jgi:hypothetical protein
MECSTIIEIGERVRILEELVPKDDRVETDAKMATGYYTNCANPPADDLAKPKGRTY